MLFIFRQIAHFAVTKKRILHTCEHWKAKSQERNIHLSHTATELSLIGLQDLCNHDKMHTRERAVLHGRGRPAPAPTAQLRK